MKASGILHTLAAANPWPSTLTGRIRGPGERQRTPFKAISQKDARTARDVALAYYENYNNKDIAGVLQLIAEDVVYEDLIYQEPFRGRDAVKAYFDKIERLVPKDIKFVVEDITDGDPKRVGVRW
jgi:nicotinamide mononucleotide adenylyltransferase